MELWRAPIIMEHWALKKRKTTIDGHTYSQTDSNREREARDRMNSCPEPVPMG
jgi:hypothetical protein